MRFWQSETSSQNMTVSSDNNFHSHYFLKYLGKDIGSFFPLNPNYFILKQLIEYLNIYLVEAMPYMPCMSLVGFFFLGNNCYHSGSKSSRVPWSLWQSTKVQSDRLAWWRRCRSDPLAWILPELPNSPSSVPGPLPHQQSSPRLSVRFMQHPACQPLNVTPVPSPCASLSLSGMKWKPDASFFLLLPSFKPGIWSTGCRMEPLFMEPLISLPACLSHSSSSGPRNYADVRTQKAGNEMIWKKKVFGFRLAFRFAIRGHLFLLKHFTQWLWSQQAFS